MTIGTKIYTWIYGNFVAEDEHKNKYYCNSKNFEDPDAKRWVIFKGEIEATKVPPHWHAWLHKTVDKPPINYNPKFIWQKKHQQNLTGTPDAYFPSSHPLSKLNKIENISEYEKWNP